jgi:hypothetical protein
MRAVSRERSLMLGHQPFIIRCTYRVTREEREEGRPGRALSSWLPLFDCEAVRIGAVDQAVEIGDAAMP